MDDVRQLVEEAVRHVRGRPDDLQRTLRLVRVRRRNRRIWAGATALILAAGSAALAWQAFLAPTSSIPVATPTLPPSPSPSPPWFEAHAQDVFARGEAAGTAWVLVDTGALLVLAGEDGTEFASQTDAPNPYLSATSYTFRDGDEAVTVAFGLAKPEVRSVDLTVDGMDPIPAHLEPVPRSEGHQTWWVAFEEPIRGARIVGYDETGKLLQSVPMHDPASISEVSGDVVSVEDGSTLGPPMIRVHLLEILFDEAARRAAVEDGVIAEGEDLPNPVYVRDLGRTRTFSVSRDALITLIGSDEHGSPTVEVSMDFAEFRSVFESGLAPPDWYGGPFRLRLEEGVVVEMRQVYVP